MTLFDLSFKASSPSFDGFIYGAKQAIAIQAFKNIALLKDSAIVWGQQGCGKTHLLEATNQAAIENSVTLLKLSDDPSSCDGLLVVDDVENITSEEQTQLFSFLNKILQMQNNNLQTLIASSDVPNKINLREDLRTRLEALPTFQLTKLQDNELVEAIVTRSLRFGRELPTVVAKELVELLPRNMSYLVAALDELDAYAIKNNLKLSAKETRHWLENKKTQ